jgi:hypothetical protein
VAIGAGGRKGDAGAGYEAGIGDGAAGGAGGGLPNGRRGWPGGARPSGWRDGRPGPAEGRPSRRGEHEDGPRQQGDAGHRSTRPPQPPQGPLRPRLVGRGRRRGVPAAGLPEGDQRQGLAIGQGGSGSPQSSPRQARFSLRTSRLTHSGAPGRGRWRPPRTPRWPPRRTHRGRRACGSSRGPSRRRPARRPTCRRRCGYRCAGSART